MSLGTKENPWKLTTPPGSSDYEMYRDDTVDPAELVCRVGSTKLVYSWRAVDDLRSWFVAQGDWVPLGATDEGCRRPWGCAHRWPIGISGTCHVWP